MSCGGLLPSSAARDPRRRTAAAPTHACPRDRPGRPIALTPPTRLLLVLAVAACALFASATSASAGRDQLTILQDDNQLIGANGNRRDATLDEWKSLGADVVKLRLDWRDISPDDKPADPSDPASYRGDKWQLYDRAIRSAQDRGMQVFLMLGGHAPKWAGESSPEGLPNGVQRPSANLFQQFVQAAGRRYSGNYTAPAGDYRDPLPLPRVTTWSMWNEPNLASWLSPQKEAPQLYRNLLYAGVDGLSATGHANDTILYGEMLPFARGNKTSGVRRHPLEFLREVACVDKRFRPYKGSSATKRGCDNFRPLPGTGIAHHPYTLSGGPRVKSPNKDDASIGELSRLVSTVDKLRSRKRFASGARQAIWSTEFGFQSDPPDPIQTPIKKVPGYMSEAEWIAFKNPRVGAWSQYPFTDDAIPDTGADRFGGFQSGIKFENGRRKPGVYDAFRFPFYVRRLSASKVEVFGGVRPAGQGAAVTVESRVGRGKWKRLVALTTGAQGYFDRNVKAPGAAKRQFRFRWEKSKSRTARAAKR